MDLLLLSSFIPFRWRVGSDVLVVEGTVEEIVEVRFDNAKDAEAVKVLVVKWGGELSDACEVIPEEGSESGRGVTSSDKSIIEEEFLFFEEVSIVVIVFEVEFEVVVGLFSSDFTRKRFLVTKSIVLIRN